MAARRWASGAGLGIDGGSPWTPWLDLAVAAGCCLIPWHLSNLARQAREAEKAAEPVAAHVDLTRHLQPEKRRDVGSGGISSSQLQLLIANAPAALFALDREGIFTLSEGQQLGRLGLKPGEVVGFSAFDIYSDNAEVKEHLRASLDGEARQWVADMGNHFFETRVLPLRDAEGNVDGVFGIATDITEHKQAQAALATSETKFSLAFNASPDSIVIATVPEGRILEVNAGFEKITGYSRQQVIGETTESIRLWHRPEQRQKIYDEMLETGRLEDFEATFRVRSGELRTCLISAKVFDLGTQRCAVSVVHDITTRKAAERALRQSEERFATAFRSSPDGISLTRLPSGEFLDLNPGFTAISGWEADEIIGKTSGDIELWADPEERRRILGVIVEGGRVRNAEMTLRRKDGALRRCRVSGEQVEMAGEPILLAVVHDITEKKAAEQALEASREKFATAFRSSPDAILITSVPDGVILEANEGFSRITGYPHDQVVGSTTVGLQLWAFEAQRQDMLEQVREHGKVADYEADFVDVQGGIHICQMSAEMVTVQGERCLLSVVRDVTERRRAEQALRLSEARLATAFRASPDAIMISQIPGGELLEVNDSFCKMTRISRQEALGKTVLELGFWKDEGEIKRLLRRLRQERQVRSFETYFYSADGNYHPCLAAVEIIDVDGDAVLLSVVRDVSELRHAEASRRRLSRMMEAISDFVAIADLDGRMLYLNGGGRRMVGLEPDADITGHHLTEFHLQEEARWLQSHVLAEIETVGAWGGETVMLHRSGRRMPALQVVTYHPGEGPEDAAFLSSIAHDITERKRMEEMLAASEERFSKAFQATPDAILLTSMPLGSVIEVNQGFSLLTGYGRNEAVGRTVSQLNIWQDPSARREMLHKLSKAGYIKNWEVRIRDRDDQVHICMLTGEMIQLGSKPCLLLLLRDVTEKRRAEAERTAFIAELESKNAELERFTYTVSHDLKSPLVTIKGFLGMLRRDLESSAIDRAMRDIDRIQNAADTMGMLLDELLELSRVGRVVEPAEDIDLGALTRDVAELLAGIVVGRGVRLHIADDLPVVFGDRQRLREVMQNLLDNAIKFLGEDNPEPSIDVGCRRDGDDDVVFVRDNGVGIDPRYHEKVFDLFDRLDPSIEGTGVGLALVKRIIEFHGGKVWVESEGLGQGSCFCFTLDGSPPLATATPER